MNAVALDPPVFYLRRKLPVASTTCLSAEDIAAFQARLEKVWPHNPSTEELEEFALRTIQTIKALNEEITLTKQKHSAE